eukprot:13279411-Alexandrium_andersonii.AAC.1
MRRSLASPGGRKSGALVGPLPRAGRSSCLQGSSTPAHSGTCPVSRGRSPPVRPKRRPGRGGAWSSSPERAA